MATATLQLYWDLASIDPKVRESATQKLVQTLADFQKAHEESLGEKKPVDTEGALDSQCAPDVSYALRRLTRGLSSSRQGARQGFSLALTELLSVTDLITVKLVLDLLLQYTEYTGSMTREEVRDMLFGRLFGFMSIIAAGMISRPTTTIEDVNRLLENLSQVAKAKAYLVEVCYHVVIQLLLSLKECSFKDTATASIVNVFLPNINTVDRLNLALTLQQQLPEVDISSKLSGWKNSNLLAASNLKRLSAILKEWSVDDEESQSDWKPQLHSVWDRILDQYLSEPATATNSRAEPEPSGRPSKKQRTNENGDGKGKKSQEPNAPFEEFWRVLVDETLFDRSSSHGRKYWGFQLVSKALPRLSSEQVPFIFTENFMRTFINNLSSNDRYLNKAAKYTANIIQQAATANKDVGFALIIQLLGKHGSQNFDQITRTKTVENLLATMDTNGIKSYLEYLAKTFYQPSEESAVDSRRSWVLKQLSLLVTNSKIPKDEGWICSIVRFLLIHAFFNVKKTVAFNESSLFDSYRKVTPELSTEIREQCKDRLQSILVALLKMPPQAKKEEVNGQLKTRKYNGYTNEGDLWSYRVVQILQELQKDKRLALAVELSEESQENYQRTWKIIEKLQKKLKQKSQDEKYECMELGFEMLFLHLMLHLYVNQEESLAALADLYNCYDKIFAAPNANGKAKKSKKAADDEDDEELQPEPVDVIVDILLSFLTSASVLKHLAEQVFEIFSHQMSQQTLDVLLSTLAPGESGHAEEDIFVEEGEEEEGEEDEDESEDDDVEEIEFDDDSDMEDAEEDQESENEPVDEELRQKVEEAMRSQGVLAGENESESDDEWDDEAMEKFDEKLAEVFKQKMLQKQQQKAKRQNVFYFKNNVLDLLTIYVRKNPTNPLVLGLITPLLDVIRNTPNKSAAGQFVTKTEAFLKNRLAKSHEVPHECGEDIYDVFKAVQDFSRSSAGASHNDLCIQLEIYLIKCIVGGDQELSSDVSEKARNVWDKILALYKDEAQDYLSKRSSKVKASILAILPQRFPHSSWPLIDTLVDFINPIACSNPYRHTQVLQWITSFTRIVGKKSELYNEKYLAIVPKITEKVSETIKLSIAQEDKKALKYEGMREFLKFVMSMVKLHKTVLGARSEALKDTWPIELLSKLESVEAYNKPAIISARKRLLDLIE